MSYIFFGNEERTELIEQLNENDWRLELSGPHGSGKSTLLFTLAHEANEQHRTCIVYRVMEDNPRLPPTWRWKWRHADVVFIDSAELLPLNTLNRLVSWIKRSRKGIIMTTHSPTGLLPVRTMTVSTEQFHAVVRHLAGIDQAILSEANALLQTHGGDARQALFTLYDLWEQRGKDF